MERQLNSSLWIFSCHEVCPRLPAGEFGGEFGEEVAGSTAAGLGQRGGVVREGGRGRRPVVRGRATVPQLAPVEGAAAGGAPGEAEAVGRGGVGDAVGRRHRVPLAAGRHRDAAGADGGGRSYDHIRDGRAERQFFHCRCVRQCNLR